MDNRWAEYLTGTMREIADSIGIDGVVALWSVSKYQDLWVAQDWQKNTSLIDLLGEEAIKKISAIFGSEYIYIPGEEIENILLAEQVFKLDRRGISTVQISKRIGVTRTRVYLLRKRFAGCKEWLLEAELLQKRRKKILQLICSKQLTNVQ